MLKGSLRPLIWLYVLLLVFEGSLRKWIVPGLSDALLIVRDPVLLLIYFAAWQEGTVRWNGFMTALVALAALAILQSFVASHDNLWIILYGLRTNFLHFPLIWVMASTLNRRDVDYLSITLLGVAVAMSALMVQQFNSPPDAYVNRGVGLGGGENLQLYGADGRIRPPGFFAFISGPQHFFPLVGALFFGQLLAAQRRLPWPVLLGIAVAIAVALPVSISRATVVGTALVAITFALSLRYVSGDIGTRIVTLLRVGIVLLVLLAALSRLSVFSQAIEVFMTRWLDPGTESGGLSDILTRNLATYLNVPDYLMDAPLLGHGIGRASNVAARLLYGAPDIGILAEEEWGKNILEMGPALGLAFIAFRFALAFHLGRLALGALREEGNALPALIFTACVIPVIQGQLAPPTILGFAVVGPGLLLAALRPDEPATAAPPPANAPRPSATFASLPPASDRRPPAVPR
jgi:hypothetical protein